MLDPDAADQDIADALDDVSARRARGERPEAEEYRARLGDSSFPRFVSALASSDLLGVVLEPRATPASDAQGLPRPFGPYMLLRELGRGAAGVVYEATHQLLKRRVAVKILHPEMQEDPTSVMRFQREIEALARINHPHIVPVHDAGVEAGRPYYAMGLIEGRPLSALVRAGRVPEPRDLARQFAGLADALEALHSAQPRLIHRDVKPANILVRNDGTALLADFGHARVDDAAALTTSGRTMGTPLYMSPEQIQGKREEMDARTDVYGLGAALYEALTGRPPFPAEHMTALIRHVLLDRPEAPRRLRPGVPPGLEAVALKALEKAPADRYASAAAMRDDLLRFAEDRPVVGRPVGGGMRLWRVVRRRWVPLTAAALLVGGAAFAWSRRPASLTLASLPSEARVFIDGVERGSTRLADVSLAPGRHTLRLATPGFEDAEVSVDLDPGATSERIVALRIKDPTDQASLVRLFGAANVPLTALTLAAPQRHGDLVTFAYPHGDVRPSDLDELAFDAGPPAGFAEHPDGIPIEFRHGTRVLGRTRLRLEHLVTPWPRRLPVPPEVRARLVPGMEVDWGWFPSAGASSSAGSSPRVRRLRVVDDAAAAQVTSELERVERLLADQPAAVRAEARVRLLLDAGLLSAAARAAEAFAAEDPLPIAWALCSHAYRLLQAGGERLDRAWSALSEEQRRAFEAAAPTQPEAPVR